MKVISYLNTSECFCQFWYSYKNPSSAVQKQKQIEFREKISGFIDLGLGVPSNEQNITQEFLM